MNEEEKAIKAIKDNARESLKQEMKKPGKEKKITINDTTKLV